MTRILSPTVPPSEGADESRWFLHRLDAGSKRGIYAETSRQRLRDAAFLDGRTRFWGREENRPLFQDKGDDLPPPRFVFHVSFCGSTMLARLLDAPGAVLSLKESHAFVDLSNQVPGDGRAEPAAKFARMISAEMSGMGTAGEQVVVKPSNWASSLIPTLCAAEAGATAIFMSTRLPLFLVAVLRGGRDRLTYTARAAAHLVSKSGLGSRALEMAVNEVTEPLTQAVRMAAVSHLVQEKSSARRWRRGSGRMTTGSTSSGLSLLPVGPPLKSHRRLGLMSTKRTSFDGSRSGSKGTPRIKLGNSPGRNGRRGMPWLQTCTDR